MAAKLPTDPNRVLLLVAVLLAVAGIGSAYLFLLPKLKEARLGAATSLAKAEADEADAASLERAKSTLGVAGAALAARGADLRNIPLTLPATEDVPGLYLQMEDLKNARAPKASAGTFEYVIGTPAAAAAPNDVRVPVSVTAAGGYQQLKLLLGLMEANVRPVSFTSVSFTQQVKDKTGYSLAASGFVRAAALSPSYAQKTP